MIYFMVSEELWKEIYNHIKLAFLPNEILVDMEDSNLNNNRLKDCLAWGN